MIPLHNARRYLCFIHRLLNPHTLTYDYITRMYWLRMDTLDEVGQRAFLTRMESILPTVKVDAQTRHVKKSARL